LKITFCPTLTLKHFILIVSVIDIILYVATLGYNGISNTGFLAPTPKALFDFGEKVNYYENKLLCIVSLLYEVLVLSLEIYNAYVFAC
jgi:hypothetical protein